MIETVRKAMSGDADAMAEVMIMCTIVREEVITEVITEIKK